MHFGMQVNSPSGNRTEHFKHLAVKSAFSLHFLFGSHTPWTAYTTLSSFWIHSQMQALYSPFLKKSSLWFKHSSSRSFQEKDSKEDHRNWTTTRQSPTWKACVKLQLLEYATWRLCLAAWSASLPIRKLEKLSPGRMQQWPNWKIKTNYQSCQVCRILRESSTRFPPLQLLQLSKSEGQN